MENSEQRDDAGDGATEAAHWLRFARRFMGRRSYQLGMTLTWILGDDGVRAAIIGLRRAEQRLDGRDKLACNEAAAILEGALEEMT